jgi:hypothetical protein
LASGTGTSLWTDLTGNAGTASNAFAISENIVVTTSATIANGGSLELNAASAETVTFTGGTGSLILDQPASFTGHIVGFTGTAPDAAHSDTIDLVGIDYNSVQFAESYNSITGLLTVSDGIDNVSFTFDNFSAMLYFASDGKGGTLITDPPASGVSECDPPADLAPVKVDNGDASLCELTSTASQDLQLIESGSTINGNRQLGLTDNDANFGSGANVTLTDHDSAVCGAGELPASELSLTNLDAEAHALAIHAGSNFVFNFGTAEASTAVAGVVNSSVSGADGVAHADVSANAVVSGASAAVLPTNANVESVYASTLKLGQSFHFKSGVDGHNGSDLPALNFAQAVIAEHESIQGSDWVPSASGAHSAVLSLLTQHSADNFNIIQEDVNATIVTSHYGLIV